MWRVQLWCLQSLVQRQRPTGNWVVPPALHQSCNSQSPWWYSRKSIEPAQPLGSDNHQKHRRRWRCKRIELNQSQNHWGRGLWLRRSTWLPWWRWWRRRYSTFRSRKLQIRLRFGHLLALGRTCRRCYSAMGRGLWSREQRSGYRRTLLHSIALRMQRCIQK